MNNKSYNATKSKGFLVPDNKIQFIADKLNYYGWGNDSKRLAKKVFRYSNSINEKDPK